MHLPCFLHDGGSAMRGWATAPPCAALGPLERTSCGFLKSIDLHLGFPRAGIQLCSGLGSQSRCVRRWDGCWIRLLDGMLQLSVAGTRDYELRVPTRIRSIVINNAAGTEDGQIAVGG